MRSLAAVFFAALLGACASSANTPGPMPTGVPRTVWVVGGDGRSVGQATFTEAPAGVMIRLEFSAGALPPGWHGLHLHARGDCSDFAAGFQASGGHLGMGNRVRHGLMNEHGLEAGDLPNVFVSPNAASGAEMFTPHVTLGPVPVRGRQPLLDVDGTALMIHQSADDHVSQPIGGAGPRIACAALTPLP